MNNISPTRISSFDPARVAFGRHETFPLRYSWLPKGFRALKESPQVFESDEATIKLGVGKNMVTAIRYWLLATRMAELEDRAIKPTALGERLLGENGWDPYLEDDATLWLVHWLIVTNPMMATSWWWFFNRYHKAEFTSQEATRALQDFVKEVVSGRYSMNTMKQDMLVLLRMYSPPRATAKSPIEDSLDSPLSTLGLIDYSAVGRRYRSIPGSRDELPDSIVGYILSELLSVEAAASVSVDELMYSRTEYPALGSAFRLTESGLLAKVERVAERYASHFEIRETAGIHQVYLLAPTDPLQFLDDYYSVASQTKERVA